MKDRKSPGIDEIPAELAPGEGVTKTIHKLRNMVCEKERWPEEWTKSVLITITKKDYDRM